MPKCQLIHITGGRGGNYVGFISVIISSIINWFYIVYIAYLNIYFFFCF